MEFLFAQQQAPVYTLWSDQPGSTGLWLKILIAFLAGIGLIVAFVYAPTRMRKPIVATFTFLAGVYWVLYYLWPTAPNRQPGDLPRDFGESVSFFLTDANSIVGGFANILTAFLLGLGIYSLLRIHLGKVFKQGKDWQFSLLLIGSLLAMTIFGYWDWYQRKFSENAAELANPDNWGIAQRGRDLLFDGLLQQMDAAMFSIIAFFILSAAYRAFRIRSIESTILLATALIVMLSLMGAVEYTSREAIGSVTGNDPNSFLNNFRLKDMADWLRSAVQTPSLRAVEFGIGVGALAMGLRLWLSLEKGGMSAS